jgi:hypothetical protein
MREWLPELSAFLAMVLVGGFLILFLMRAERAEVVRRILCPHCHRPR